MDFVLISDLHVDVNYFDDTILNTPENLNRWLLVAGDTFTNTLTPSGYIVSMMDKMSAYFAGVIFVLGNHDYYGRTIDNTIHHVNEQLKELNNPKLVFMDGKREKFIIPGTNIEFFGGTLWSKMQLNGMEKNIGDYFHIKSKYDGHLTFAETNIINKKELADIEAFLKDGSGGQKIIFTHFPPLHSPQGYRSSWLDNYFHNNHISDWFKQPFMKDVYWIHGHSHVSYFDKCYNSYIITNARGYINTEHFSPMLITID